MGLFYKRVFTRLSGLIRKYFATEAQSSQRFLDVGAALSRD